MKRLTCYLRIFCKSTDYFSVIYFAGVRVPDFEELMKIIRNGGVAIFCVSILTTGVAVANDDYRCTIERLSLAEGDSGGRYDLYKRLYIGKQFTVERESGLMAGALKNSYPTKPQVIDRGSEKNAYKVVTTMRLDQGAGEGSDICALTVVEFEQGAKKPFVFLEDDAVFFGYCEHF